MDNLTEIMWNKFDPENQFTWPNEDIPVLISYNETSYYDKATNISVAKLCNYYPEYSWLYGLVTDELETSIIVEQIYVGDEYIEDFNTDRTYIYVTAWAYLPNPYNG